jgi:hypothetical protein
MAMAKSATQSSGEVMLCAIVFSHIVNAVDNQRRKINYQRY